MKTPTFLLLAVAIAAAVPSNAPASNPGTEHTRTVTDEFIAHQRSALSRNTEGKGFGPQSPRDVDNHSGRNKIRFSAAPAASSMNLCNIHFHKNAEHQGGEFRTYAGNGDGYGYDSGYEYSGTLTAKEAAPIEEPVCDNLNSGDTIEVHYVHSTAQVKPGPTLASCLSQSINNPQLRVEAQVFVLVNDPDALDFVELARHGSVGGYQQATNMPQNTGTPITYAGSTTGPGYNEEGSPFQVTWSVHPKVAKVNTLSVDRWCKNNVFNENHAHGVRNLVVNPALLSDM
jgi:hypothetical protein